MGVRVVRSAPLTLRGAMYEASRNAPVFLDAFYTASAKIAVARPDVQIPTHETMNKMLENFGIGYRISPPNLLLIEELDLVPVPTTSLIEKAHEEFTLAVGRSEAFLRDHKPRQAVEEVLWLLESVATAFSGISVGTTLVHGKYFNEILKSLRHAKPSSILEKALSWLQTFHGYLSSPTGGGIRHGRALDLSTLAPHEAELFCNLTRSYISYLLSEYEQLRGITK